jgi:phosphoribosylglycinamide formyltransferase-1
MPAKIAILASGDGSNFEALARAAQTGVLPAQVVGLITNRDGVEALNRARRLGIPAEVLIPKNFAIRAEWDKAVTEQLKSWGAEWVVCAGFLALLGPQLLQSYPQRVVNSHPALLPKYGGHGMYGDKVHAAVVAAGESETGITFHLVDEVYDHGRVLVQEKIPVLPGETAASLAARLKARENEIFPKVLADLLSGRLTR